MIKIGNTVILNGDEKTILQKKELEGFCLLTCGLSLRSTITASSIQDDGFTYCLQRGIFTLDGKEIAPQEFNISWRKKPEDIYPYLALVTLMLICGASVELFAQLQF